MRTLFPLSFLPSTVEDVKEYIKKHNKANSKPVAKLNDAEIESMFRAFECAKSGWGGWKAEKARLLLQSNGSLSLTDLTQKLFDRYVDTHG